MSDCNMAIQDIYTLFIQDDSISDAKKKNLTPLYKPASSRLLLDVYKRQEKSEELLPRYEAASGHRYRISR